MKLIALILPARPLEHFDLRSLHAARQRGFVVALLDSAYDSPAVQARLLRLGAVDAAVICRVHAPELIARLMDADEMHVIN